MPRPYSIPIDQRRALTTREAAASLSLSLDTFNDLVTQGEIPLTTFRTSKGTLIKVVRQVDLDAFLARHVDGANIAPIGLARRRA